MKSNLNIQIDQLVDGELGEAERQSLLKSLDNEPEAWRRCALAFLEDQAFRQSVATVKANSQTTLVAVTPPKRRIRVFDHLKVAATVLVAFGLGWSVKAERTAAPLATTIESTMPQVPEPVHTLAPAPTTPAADLPVRLASMPEPTEVDPERAQLTAWERAGFEVHRQTRLMALDTKDGQQVAVPVNEVQLLYVGNRTY